MLTKRLKRKKSSEFTRKIDKGVWVESEVGFKVLIYAGHPKEPTLLYEEAGRQLWLDVLHWHESPEDRKAIPSEMTSRQLKEYMARTLTLVYVPGVWKWFNSEEIISPE